MIIEKFVGWSEQDETGRSYISDHAYIHYQIPQNAGKYPLVYIHGFGGSGVCWEITPDDRDGFTTLMLKRGSLHTLWTYQGVAEPQELQIPQPLRLLLTRCFSLVYGEWESGRILMTEFSSVRIPLIYLNSSGK